MIVIPYDKEDYKQYINRIIKSRENIKDKNMYQERHHIIPKCLGGNNDEENLLFLYPQEHYYAHKLLAIENESNKSLQFAWWNMSHCITNDRIYEVTEEDYNAIRQRVSSIMSDFMKKRMNSKDNHFIGTHRSKEFKIHMSKVMSKRKKSDETKIKMSLNHANVLGKNNPRAKKVLCVETGEVFDCAKDAGLKYNNVPSNPGCCIRSCCNKKRKTSGVHPVTKTPLHWEWID